MPRATLLTEDEVVRRLAALGSGWRREAGTTLVRHFEFADFVAAMRFVNRLAEAAEASQHHPDLDIRYNKVKVAYTTHDSGGLTANDFEMAAKTDEIGARA